MTAPYALADDGYGERLCPFEGEYVVYTFQMIGLYLIVSVSATTTSVPQAPTTIVKVGSFRTTDDCLDASKAAVFGKNVTGSDVQKNVEFMCIPEASQRSWGVASSGPPPLVVRRLN